SFQNSKETKPKKALTILKEKELAHLGILKFSSSFENKTEREKHRSTRFRNRLVEKLSRPSVDIFVFVHLLDAIVNKEIKDRALFTRRNNSALEWRSPKKSTPTKRFQ
ncbi:hypothetical protein AVEN_231894-1, partial [Araneus ventricosus]